MKYILVLIAGILASNSADLYCRIKFERWVEKHKPKTIGMPITWDLCLGSFIARPIDSLLDNDVTCGLLEE